MSLALIPQGMNKMLGAFRKFAGPSSSVKITGQRLTYQQIRRLVPRSFGRLGSKISGIASISRRVPMLDVVITATFTDRFDRVLADIQVEVHRIVAEVAKLIRDISFRMCPRDTGRLEATVAIVDNTFADGWPVQFSIEYGPAIDPDTGDDYTLFAHFGDYNRGLGTIAKGPEAGPLFLTRPIEALHNVVLDMIANAVRRGIAGT